MGAPGRRGKFEKILMKTIEEIKKRIQEDQQIYKDQYKVKELKIFGSYVKSEHT